jgi:hypothetical protein
VQIFIIEENHIALMDRTHRRAVLEEDLTKRGIPVPLCPVPLGVAPRAKSSSSTAHLTHRERRRPAALNAPMTN